MSLVNTSYQEDVLSNILAVSESAVSTSSSPSITPISLTNGKPTFTTPCGEIISPIATIACGEVSFLMPPSTSGEEYSSSVTIDALCDVNLLTEVNHGSYEEKQDESVYTVSFQENGSPISETVDDLENTMTAEKWHQNVLTSYQNLFFNSKSIEGFDYVNLDDGVKSVDLSDFGDVWNSSMSSTSKMQISEAPSLFSASNSQLSVGKEKSRSTNPTAGRRSGFSSFFTERLFNWKRSPFGSNSSLNSIGSLHSANSVNNSVETSGTTGLVLQSRPSGLPPKDPIEEEMHQRQHEELLRQFKRKLRQDELARLKTVNRRKEAELDREKLLNRWVVEFLPNWDSVKCSEKVRRYWWLGVPSKVRGHVWKLQIGNQLGITRCNYEVTLSEAVRLMGQEETRRRAKELARRPELVQRRDSFTSDDSAASTSEVTSTLGGGIELRLHSAAHHVRQVVRDSLEDDTNVTSLSAHGALSLRYILLDVSRTLPDIKLFQEGGPYYDRLVLLLCTFSLYRPDVGYIQGMSFIAAVLLLIMEEDFDAFVCFANILNKPCLQSYYRLHHALLECYEMTFSVFLHENLPELSQHLTATNFLTRPLLVDWIFTMYAKNLNFEVACRIWDLFLRDGDEFLFRVALGILRMHSDYLRQLDFNQMMELLKNPLLDLNEELLFENIAAIRMTVTTGVMDKGVGGGARSQSFDEVLLMMTEERQPERVIRTERLLEMLRQSRSVEENVLETKIT